MDMQTYPSIESVIGNTPLVALQRINAAANAEKGNVVLGKLEGNNPAGSVKDRPAVSMISESAWKSFFMIALRQISRRRSLSDTLAACSGLVDAEAWPSLDPTFLGSSSTTAMQSANAQ